MTIHYLDGSGAIGAWHFNNTTASTDLAIPDFTLVSGTTAYSDIWPGLRGLINTEGSSYQCLYSATLDFRLRSSVTVEMLCTGHNCYGNLGSFLVYLGNWRAEIIVDTTKDYLTPRFAGRAVSSDSEGAGISAPTSIRGGQPVYIAFTRETLIIGAVTSYGLYNVYVNGQLVITSGLLAFPADPSHSFPNPKLKIYSTISHSEIGVASLVLKNYCATATEITNNYNYCLGGFYGRQH